MVKRLRLVALLVLLVLGGALALGQSADQQRILTPDEQAKWPAIGLISYNLAATGSICTGTLVAADLVLTAAHCVAKLGVPFAPDDIYFFAGWRDGKSLASRRGTAIYLAKGAEQKRWSMKSDMALVVLDTAIPASVAAPLPLASDAAVVGTADFIGYRRDARQFAHLAEACLAIDGDKPVIGLGCSVVTGNSGSPVVQKSASGWQIAAVIVSYGTGEGGVLAYAVRPSVDIRSQIAQH